MSLDQIITAQIDEPKQSNCIYQAAVTDIKQDSGIKQKFTQIRVKSIEFLNEKAIAIYFYDTSHQVEALK